MLADICRIAGLNLICLAAFSASLVGWAEGDSEKGSGRKPKRSWFEMSRLTILWFRTSTTF